MDLRLRIVNRLLLSLTLNPISTKLKVRAAIHIKTCPYAGIGVSDASFDKTRTAEKICTKNLVTVRPYESVHTAEKKMGQKGKYTRLPVLGGMEECVGLITSNSILKNPTARKVEEAMEPRPMIIDQDTVITQEIEALLYDTRSCILVSKRNSSSIMGIIEAWDLIPKKGKK